MTGRIFDIERFSIHNGPGIRTTVFFKGCPLRCLWCHNPEGIDPRPEVAFDEPECGRCGDCARACPHQAHSFEGDAHRVDRERCERCGACAEACPAGCLKMVGRAMNVADVMAEVLADRAFYRRTGGGLTLSGGEPLLQIDFAAALLEEAAGQGLHCCVETCGMVSWDSLLRVARFTDLFLFDCKETDRERHRRLTGQPNDLIVRNLRRLHDEGAAICLQCPIVPGLNDGDAHLEGIAALAGSLPRLSGVRVLPYHPLGRGKRAQFGTPSSGLEPAVPTAAQVEGWTARLKNLGVHLL